MDGTLKTLGDIGIVPVVKIENPERAAGLGRALVAGGIPAAEVTFRTAAAERAIRAMREEVPGILVGAGTVLDRATALAAMAAGAAFIVSPGFDDAVVDLCLERGMPVLPGVNGPDGVMRGIAKGLSVLKFFPAVQSGGLPMIEALAGPFASIRYIPTGGIDASSLGLWARSPSIHAVGGSWMVPLALVEAGDWPGIEALCRASVRALHGFRVARLGAAAGTGAFGMPGMLSGLCEGLEGSDSGDYLAISCNSVERALAWLSRSGASAREGSAVMARGRIVSVELEGGSVGAASLAVRLIRA